MKETILIDIEFKKEAASGEMMSSHNHRFEVKRQAIEMLKDAGYQLEKPDSYNQLAAGTSAV